MSQANLTNTNQWSHTPHELFDILQSSPQGLSSISAQERLAKIGLNLLQSREKTNAIWLFLNQFKSPLVLILVFAAIISIVTGEYIDASIILAIVVASAVLGFIQEYGASNAVEKLRSQVTFKVNVLRATGAGDAWNAGNIFADGNGLSDEGRLTLANAVAACYLARPDGVHPTREQLTRFLKKRNT